MKLTEHNVLVTGGSNGVGLAIAKAFSQLGCRVAVCGRDRQKLESVEREGSEIRTIQYDLQSSDTFTDLLDEVVKTLGGLSILINNAAIQKNYKFYGRDQLETASDVNQEIQINLASLINLSSASLPLLAANSSAAVVNITSALAITPKANAPVYCATKAAVHSYSCAMRFQLQDEVPQIKVFEAMLPLVDTEMTRGRGKGKISPAAVATALLKGMARDQYEIVIGKAKLLRIMHRFAPSVASSILRNS